MGWVRVSDDFYDHGKFAQLSALGDSAWIRGLAYANRNLTDGFIPKRIAKNLIEVEGLGIYQGSNSGRDAEPLDGVLELVTTGLWDAIEGGYQIHDYLQYQPSKAQVEAKAKATTERVNKFREQRNGVGNSVGNAESNAPVTPLLRATPNPTPNPIRTKDKELVQQVERDFAEFWNLYPRKQSKVDAHKAYVAARKTNDADTILAGVQRYLLANLGADKSFLKLAGGWLRGERWADEVVTSVPLPVRSTEILECEFHPGYPLPCDACARDGRPF